MIKIIGNDKYLYKRFCSKNKAELLNEMSSILISEKFVKESYRQAVIDREEVFPTGLPVSGVNIAIPHTDSIHVKKEGILVGVLEKPIEFEVMASSGEFIKVDIVFMLAIKDPKKQIDMLQNLMLLCQNNENLIVLKEGEDKRKIMEILENIC